MSSILTSRLFVSCVAYPILWLKDYKDRKDQEKFLKNNVYNYRHITTIIRNSNIIKNFMKEHSKDGKDGYFYIYK